MYCLMCDVCQRLGRYLNYSNEGLQTFSVMLYEVTSWIEVNKRYECYTLLVLQYKTNLSCSSSSKGHKREKKTLNLFSEQINLNKLESKGGRKVLWRKKRSLYVATGSRKMATSRRSILKCISFGEKRRGPLEPI